MIERTTVIVINKVKVARLTGLPHKRMELCLQNLSI